MDRTFFALLALVAALGAGCGPQKTPPAPPPPTVSVAEVAQREHLRAHVVHRATDQQPQEGEPARFGQTPSDSEVE